MAPTMVQIDGNQKANDAPMMVAKRSRNWARSKKTWENKVPKASGEKEKSRVKAQTSFKAASAMKKLLSPLKCRTRRTFQIIDKRGKCVQGKRQIAIDHESFRI